MEKKRAIKLIKSQLERHQEKSKEKTDHGIEFFHEGAAMSLEWVLEILKTINNTDD